MRTRDNDDDRGSRRSSRDEEPSRGRGRDRDEEPARRRSSRDDDDRGSSRRSSRDEEPSRGSSRSRGHSAYEYEGRTREQMTKRGSQGANEFDKFLEDFVKSWKPNDKDNTIRIVPPTWAKPKHYGYDIWVHYGIGPDRQSYLCLNKMAAEAEDAADRLEKDGKADEADELRASIGKCPCCAERAEAAADGDEKLAKDLDAKRRVLTYLVDRDHEGEGLQAWASPWTVDRDICKVSVDRKTGDVLPIDHPEEGFDVEFEKKGAKEKTEYLGVAVARRSSSLGNDSWLDQAMEHPLPTILKFYSAKHIAAIFGGASKKRHRDDDDDDRPTRGRGRDDDDDRPSRGRGRDDDEPKRGRDRDDDDEPKRGRGRDDDEPKRGKKEPPTWEEIHDMTSSELDALVDDERLRLDPDKFDSDEELADAICEELDIDKPRGRGRVSVEAEEDGGRGKLAEMRRNRER